MNDTSDSGTALRVAVGMSGGVDSSVAAARLMEQGHEVVGFTAHLWTEGTQCCSLEDATRARHVAQFIGFEHYVIDAMDFFGERIVDAFVEEYAAGRTPSPCVMCNQIVKFGLLLRDALELGCTHIATGHYARLDRRGGLWRLLRGVDEKKDQSYFLHRLSQGQLEHILFPLGEWTKEQTKAYAESLNLPVTFHEESQDLCFVRQGGYAEFLEARNPQLKRQGSIRDTSGREVGTHDGIHKFTIGQREGIGVAAGDRLYVKEIDSEANVVVVGRREEITTPACRVRDVNWISGEPPADGVRLDVRLRYRHAAASGILRLDGESDVEVVFEEPQFAVTPGQAAVFYDGDEVVGGGWILR